MISAAGVRWQRAVSAESSGLAQRQVEPVSAKQRVLIVLERRHTVIAKPGWAAPDEDIAVGKQNALLLVGPVLAAEQEHGRNADSGSASSSTALKEGMIEALRQTPGGHCPNRTV